MTAATHTTDAKNVAACKLDDAELAAVCGGGIGQTVGDAAILKKKGYMSEDVGFFDTCAHWHENANKVGRAWLKAGLEVGLSYAYNNKYWIDGRRVSRTEALEYLESL